jgi:PAS domain S-box-containing protein
MTQSTFIFAFQQAPIGMAIVQTDGTVLQMNNWLHSLCGCAEQEWIGQRFHDLLYPEDRHVYEQIVKVSEYGLSSAPVIVRLIGRDSTITQAKLTVQMVEETETEPPNVLVFINTLSDPLTSERMIQTIKGWDQSLFLHNPAMIVSVNLKGYIYAANEAAEQITGYAIEDLIGQDGYMFLDEGQDELHNNLYQGTSCEQPVAYEARIRRKDGKLIEMGMKNVPIIIDGKVAGLYVIGRDITENKQTEEILRKADRLNVVGQLAAGLAHEIRNPLTAIRGFLQLIRMGQQKDTYFTMMLSELDRINNILGELLIVSKPQVTQFQRKDLVQLLKDVLNLLNPQSILQSVRYRTLFEAEQLFVDCSETELKQVFINIIKNGIEAMPNGGILTVRLKHIGANKIIIRIIDQGVGIPKDRIPKLGEPFYTTKERGTGLGLMMCNKIIDSHKGTIAISSKENLGTTVDVVLPLS